MNHAQNRRRYPLYIHVATLFTVLIVSACGVLTALAYSRGASMLNKASDDVFVRIAREIVDSLQAVMAVPDSVIDLFAIDPIVEAGNLEARLQRLPNLAAVLRASDNIDSAYVGYRDGDFLLLRRIPAAGAFRDPLGAPGGARYLLQSVEREPGREARARYYFLADDLRVLRSEERPEYAAFDPRKRPWYVEADGKPAHIKTEPYVFYSSRDVGTTVARQARGGNAVVGLDITLADLSRALARQKLTPGTQVSVVEQRGGVVAHVDMTQMLREPESEEGAARRATVEELGSPILAALAAHIRDSRALDTDSAVTATRSDAEGRDWRTMLLRLAVEGANDYFLALAVPEDELLQDARDMGRDGLLASLAVLLLSIPATLLVARYVSTPIRDLAAEAEAVRRFDFSPGRVRSVVREVDDLAVTMEDMRGTIRRFLDISASVAAEQNFDRLLPRLLDQTIEACEASGGVLYLAQDEDARLVAACARLAGGLPASRIPASVTVCVAPAFLAGALGQRRISTGALAAADIEAADLHGVCANAAAAYVTIPLYDRKRDLLGVILLLRASRADAALLAFAEALAGSAAVSLETKELLKAQKDLFDAFIRLIAGAIDAKSPYTGGHCERVPELTKMLARAACEAGEGPWKEFSLSEEQWEAVHVASWLHDCGKVTTPEYVVDKSTKLETICDRIHEVRMRFEVLKRDAEIRCWRQVADGGDRNALQDALASELRALDEEFAFVAACNEGGEFMDEERRARLRAIGARTWLRTLSDRLGISQDERLRKERTPPEPLPAEERLLDDKPEHVIERYAAQRYGADNRWGFRVEEPDALYNRGELHNLCIGRGTLSEEERFKINEHIIQTIIMLSALPFPKHLRSVPEIAGGHHEKMDGTGYPKRLRREDMSPVARMMAIADIFEALTASDRPYKKAKSISEAIRIMSLMRRDGHVDPDLFELFLSSGVYRQYAERFLDPSQIDEVEVESYIAAR